MLSHVVFLAALLQGAEATPSPSPIPPTPSTSLDQAVPELRRAMKHGELLERLADEATAEGADTARVAGWTALIASEKRLLERVLPLDRVSVLALDDLIGRLTKLELDSSEELAFARFLFFRDKRADGEKALARARDGSGDDRFVTDESNRLLAVARKEDVPRGGYFRYRGRFVSMERRDRERSLDEALERLAAQGALVEADAFAPNSDVANLESFEKRFGGGGPDVLRNGATRIRAALTEDYAEVRGWLPSYAKQPSQRERVRAAFEVMREPRKEQLALIRRYDKPEQPAVDRNRRALKKLYDDYLSKRNPDRRALAAVGVAEADALLVRIRARERALESVHHYLHNWARPGLTDARVQPPAGAAVTSNRILTGRKFSGLEDSMWIVVHVAAGRDVDALDRIGEIMTQRRRLTEWERLLLDDLHGDVIERYNDRCISTLDGEERQFIRVNNAYRRALGLSPFEVEERLNTAARKHSREMVDLRYFGHISPVDRHKTPSDRVNLEGYAGGVGENCLGGRVDGRGAFEGWYHSPGHHRGMISGGPHVGIGAARNHSMWTQVMGGEDKTWRSYHFDASPARRQALADLAENLAAAEKAGAVAAALVEAIPHAAPDSYVAVATEAFAAAGNPRRTDRESWPALLDRVISAELPTSWRWLQIAAVETCIEGLAIEATADVRWSAWAVVKAHLSKGLEYEPEAEEWLRRKQVDALRIDWQDVARTRFRQGEIPAPPRRARLPNRGDGPATVAPMKVLTARERLTIARKLGGGSKTEKSVEAALKWLARVQSEDGAWRSISFSTTDKRFSGHEKKLGLGNREWEIGMTGLSLLAFMSAGNTPTQGKHADVVKRGVDFLCAQLIDDGRFRTTASHYMYNHALGTQALCEAYGYTADPQIYVCAQHALDYLAYAQHQLSGGWRYKANEQGDTSVTGWVIMALNAGAKARLDVAGFRGALRFLNSVTTPAYFYVGYTGRHDGGTTRLGAVGAVARLFLENDSKDIRIRMAAWRCLKVLPAKGKHDFYYLYYATLAMHQVGGDEWEKWNEALVEALLAEQDGDRGSPFLGSWPPRGEWANHGGRIYQTAMAALMFTTYYRYQRDRSPRVVPFTGDLTKSVKPYVETIRSATDDRARAIASRKLVDIYGTAAAAVLVKELRNREQAVEVRRRFALLLPDCVAENHESALLDLLSGETDGELKETLTRSIESIASHKSVDVLIGQLEAGRREVRVFAARTLGRIGDGRATAPLGARLETEKDGWVKNTIEEALRRIAHRRAVDVLVDDALGKRAKRRLVVVDGLSVLDRTGVADKALATEENEEKIHAEIIRAIKKHREAAAVPILIAMLSCADEDTRRESFKLLGAITKQSHDFKPESDKEARDGSIVKWRHWWSEETDSLP